MMRALVLVLLLLSACAPYEQKLAVASGKAKLTKDRFITVDGASLPYRCWVPNGKPKAVVAALHGFNDYNNAFAIPGDYFRTRGIALCAYDQRGFGAAPEAGTWAGEENLVTDLHQFSGLLQNRYPGTPFYVLGESMGGAVAMRALNRPDFPQTQGLILVSPAVWGGDTLNPFYRLTLWVAAHTFPDEEFTGSDLKIQATSNIPLLRQMAMDPLVIKKTRVDAIYGMVHLMDNAYWEGADVKVPVLLLYGKNDQVIPPQPIHHTLMNFGEPVRFAFYPDGYHMLLRDLQGDEVMGDIASWIKDPNHTLPSGYTTQYAPETK